MDKFLTPLLSKADSMPFLFLGSGFSRRYLKTPSWMELLEYIANLTFNNKTGFQKVKRKADKKHNIETEYNSYMTYLCDLISDELDEIWYDDERFAKSRKDNWNLLNQSVPPIKIEIANYLKSFKEIVPDMVSELTELENISPNSIAGIITTNYDTLQENIFDYEVYSSQEELLFHTKYDLGEIYKIHGSVNKPDSILINSSDYEIIEQKHKYIAAKLLTIFVEHPIFFIGYSIGDEDIRGILNDIQLSLTQSQLKEIEDRLFYVVWDDKEKKYSASTYTITFENGRSITIKQLSLNDYSLLYKCLSKNKAKYPIKLLRHVKEDMYNLVLTNDPKNRMMLSLPDKELSPEEMEKIEFVYGFGIMERARNGYKILSTAEIFRDVLFDDGNLNAELFVTETLPYALQKSSGFLPIRKYTSQIDENKLPEQVKNNLLRFDTLDKLLPQGLIKEKKALTRDMTFERAMKSSAKVRLNNLALIPYTKTNIDQLGDFLRENMDQNNFQTTTEIRRLIRIYDFIKNK